MSAPTTTTSTPPQPVVAGSADKMRLLLCRQLWDQATQLAEHSDDMSRMTASILLDLAVETALKTVLGASRGSIDADSKFRKLVEESKELIPSGARTLALRNARNAVVHDGVPPTHDAVRRFLGEVRPALEETFKIFGLAFDGFTSISLVSSPTLRCMLEEASAMCAAGRVVESIIKAGAAFHYLRGRLADLMAAAFDIDTFPMETPFWASPRWYVSLADNRGEMLITMMDALSDVALGFDLDERARFQGLRRNAEPSKDVVPAPVTLADAQWAIDYVARHAFRLEQSHPSLRELHEAEVGDARDEGATE